MFSVILLYALFASLFGFSKATLDYSEPFFLIGSRMAFAGLLLLAFQAITNPTLLKIHAKHLKLLILLAFLNIYLTNIAEIWGMQYMTSAKACLIYSLSPFVAALLSHILLKEKLSSKKWLGVFAGFIGLIPIFSTQSQAENFTGEIISISLADITLLTAVFCSTYGWILLKKLVDEHQYSPITMNGFSMALGGTIALIHSYFAGESWAPIPVTDFSPFLHNTLWMCLISNIICYNLYGFLLKRYTATFMAFSGLITPLFASFFGWFFYHETITWHFFASLIIFSISLALFYQEELKQNKRKLLETA